MEQKCLQMAPKGL